MGYSENDDKNLINKTNAASDLDIYFQTPPDTRQEQNVFIDTYSNDAKKEEVQSNVISGMKIVEDVDVSDIGDMLASINKANAKLIEEEEAKAERQKEEADKAHEEEIQKRHEEILKKRAEEEAKLREQRRLEEEAFALEEEEKKNKKREKKQESIAVSTVKDAVKNIKVPDINNPLKEVSEVIKEISDKDKDSTVKENPVKEKKEKPIKEKTPKEKVNINIPIPNISFTKQKKSASQPKTVTENNIDWKAKATTDSLTGLKNLTAYEEESEQFDISGTFIFVDINCLKITNDTYGHEAGDILITSVAKVLEKAFPSRVYRIGGDEFAILTTDKKDIIDKKITSIRKSLDKYTKSDKTGIIYACAIGIAVGDGTKTIKGLRQEADADMYEDKKKYKAGLKNKQESAKSEEVQDKANTKNPVKPAIKNKFKPKKSDAEEINNIPVQTDSAKENGIDWKELAMIDQKTKLKNKLALSMAEIEKTDTIALIRIPQFSAFKREEGDRQISLIAELIKHNIKPEDNAYFIEEGSFIVIYKQKKTGLDQIKIKARALSLNTEITTLTGNNSPIDEIIDLLKQKLNTKGVEGPKTYDEKLTVTQRKLKEAVRDNHSRVQEDDFEQSLMQIQRKANDIIAVFMTDKDFNILFIFFDVFDFLDKIYELQDSIDFSYIYAVYPGGALYYGADEYTNDINNLFQKIAEGIQSNVSISAKDIQKIDGINIFEKIYVA